MTMPPPPNKYLQPFLISVFSSPSQVCDDFNVNVKFPERAGRKVCGRGPNAERSHSRVVPQPPPNIFLCNSTQGGKAKAAEATEAAEDADDAAVAASPDADGPAAAGPAAGSDIVTISGSAENCEKAKEALLVGVVWALCFVVWPVISSNPALFSPRRWCPCLRACRLRLIITAPSSAPRARA